jgi:DNA-binding NtrC family response regulator
VVAVRLPPLRERPEDIPTLTRFFLAQLSGELGLPAPEVDHRDLDQLRRYDWPGNVRELRNVVERCLLLGRRPGQCIAPDQAVGGSESIVGDVDMSLEAVERRHILSVLCTFEGNKSAAARELGVSRKTLERKLKAWGAEQGRFE